MNHPAIGACADTLAMSTPAATGRRRRGLWALLFDGPARLGVPERLDALDARGLRDIGWWCVGRRHIDHESLSSHRIDFFL